MSRHSSILWNEKNDNRVLKKLFFLISVGLRENNLIKDMPYFLNNATVI